MVDSDLEYLIEHGYVSVSLDEDNSETLSHTLKGSTFVEAVSRGLIESNKFGDYDDRLFELIWNTCESALRNAAE